MLGSSRVRADPSTVSREVSVADRAASLQRDDAYPPRHDYTHPTDLKVARAPLIPFFWNERNTPHMSWLSYPQPTHPGGYPEVLPWPRREWVSEIKTG